MKELVHGAEKFTNFTLANAEQLASSAHEGQIDKEGEPYKLHPLRVMKALESYGPAAQMAGVLHDVVEDTDITPEDLVLLGVPKEVVGAISSVTKQAGEAYADALKRAKNNQLGSLVKIADNRDNSISKRLAKLPKEERNRLTAKYAKAIMQLTEGDEWLAGQVQPIQERIEELYKIDQNR